MDIYQTFGLFYVIFATGLATAGLIVCAGLGAAMVYRRYKSGISKEDFERIMR